MRRATALCHMENNKRLQCRRSRKSVRRDFSRSAEAGHFMSDLRERERGNVLMRTGVKVRRQSARKEQEY